jgi:organic hydroperoxide reductase OsmC/OhrA
MPWRPETDTVERFKAGGCFSWTFELLQGRKQIYAEQEKNNTRDFLKNDKDNGTDQRSVCVFNYHRPGDKRQLKAQDVTG